MTAVYITGIIAAALVASSVITARRELALSKHRAANDRVRTLHRKANNGETCVYCAPLQRVGYDTTWPCDTIRALDGAPIKENNA